MLGSYVQLVSTRSDGSQLLMLWNLPMLWSSATVIVDRDFGGANFSHARVIELQALLDSL